MFKQLFGNYLLNKKLITPAALNSALDYQKDVRLKLGVMAVNAGYMTAEQVEAVHFMQTKIDKRFGEIAIQMGFLDEEQLKTLLATQKSDYLTLGQALVDTGDMTLEQFEKALNEYKNEYKLTNEQLKLLEDGNVDELVSTFFRFNQSPKGEVYKEYLSLLLRNLIRFIDDGFRPLEVFAIDKCKTEWIAVQEIMGEMSVFTCFSADADTFIKFAEKYTQESLTENDEYTQACVGEFINLVNGLFIVNKSNDNIELELTPQEIYHRACLNKLVDAFCIQLAFSFGRVDIIIASERPEII